MDATEIAVREENERDLPVFLPNRGKSTYLRHLILGDDSIISSGMQALHGRNCGLLSINGKISERFQEHQSWFQEDSLVIHNTEIMNCSPYSHVIPERA